MVNSMNSPVINSVQKQFIHGKWIDSQSSEFTENFNPATGEKLCDVQCANEADLEKAIESAHKGFKIWSNFKASQRSRILFNAAQIIRSRLEELSTLETIDTGKPIQECRTVDIPSAAEALEYFAGVAPTIHGDHYEFGKSFIYTRREPLGVCAGIGAWNYPFQIATWKSAPALACGNAMIYKPSDLTPLSAMKLAEIYLEAGVPEGVFNVLHGQGSVGQALCRHPGISKVSLTGSVPTGQKVMEAAASTLKHITLELGGKSPLIVFEDADLKQAVSGALIGNFFTQGEICLNGTRVFVHEKVLNSFIDALIDRTKKIKIGNPLHSETQMGALISRPHLHKVLRYIESGKKEGAELLTGGKTPVWKKEDEKFEKGNFLEPTVFLNCQDHMTMVREEIFGPVMSVLTFKSEEEVIERANKTTYGLAAGIFTQNLQRAHSVVARLQAGTCWINTYGPTPVEVPFGGYKMSGIGKENGLAAVQHYTQLKSVYVEMEEIQSPF